MFSAILVVRLIVKLEKVYVTQQSIDRCCRGAYGSWRWSRGWKVHVELRTVEVIRTAGEKV